MAKKKTKLDVYSPKEEVANAISHGLGFILGLIGTGFLLIETEVFSSKFWAFLIFGVSVCLLYLASTLYHAVKAKKQKWLFKKLDHIAIYLLIAGTFTPFSGIVLANESVGRIVLVAVWSIAVAGIIFKFFFTGRFEAVSLISYLGMGWMGFLMFDKVGEILSPEAVHLLLYGGLCYTGGVVFYLWRKLPYHHAIWHVCVLGGTAFHYASVYVYVIPF